jgi:hypothetical protein
MSDTWVVDTNVGIVANGRDEDGPHHPECIIACVRFLNDITQSGHITIDDRWEIIREYKHDMHSSGQPGPGDAFLKWVLVNNANPDRCDQIDISAITVPDQLADFDSADHKFIRTALGCLDPRIAEATDGLWWKRRADFDSAGITIKFLCPEEIKSNSARKHGSDD